MVNTTRGDTATGAPVRRPRRHQRRIRLWGVLLIGLLTFGSLGCPTAVQYQANDRLVETLGAAQARQRLQETVLRSVNPRVIEVNPTEEFFHYKFQQPIMGPYGIHTDAVVSENRVYYQHVNNVQVFDNHVVFVRAPTQQILAQLIFATDEDARAFADLVTSFRARRVK